MANFSFVLRQPKKPGTNVLNPELTPVILIFSYDAKNRFKCQTDLKVEGTKWDSKKQKRKDKAPGATSFNKRLKDLEENLLEYYNELLANSPDITYLQIKEKIQFFVKNGSRPDMEEKTGFFDVFDKYIEANKPEVSPRTIQKYNSVKTSLQKFSGLKRKYNNLSFSQIDLNFFDTYKTYLLTEVYNQKSGEKGYRDDTVAKYIENLKNYLLWALDRGYHKNRDFQKKKFSVSRKPKQDIVTLSMDELRTLYKHDFSNSKKYDNVRDLFCFAAFTGQRWADIERFDKKQIVGDAWIFEAQKTKKQTIIPFLGYIAPALDILKKHDFKLPDISNQKFNDYIKEAAELAELKREVEIKRYQGNKEIVIKQPLHKFISMHTGRRTAVSLLLNVAKMPIPQVMEITQHSDYDTLKKYIVEDKDALRTNLAKTRSVDFKMEVVKSMAQ